MAILAMFLALGLSYSLIVPPFETPDEIHHYAFARHLAQGHGLPVQTHGPQGLWAHEGTQPPLYYFLVGRLTAWIPQDDFEAISQFNPHANMGNPLYPGNKNRMLYSARPLPLTGANLALHVGRWFSLLLATITLWLVYRIARLAFPGARSLALVTLLIVATIPQFAFISASLSNDNMIILISTAAVYWLARLLRYEPTRPIGWQEWGVLGVLLGLAALSKLQGLGLFGLSAATLAVLAWQRRDWRLPVRAALPVLLPAVAIAGWWYWRNYTLYGEWLGINRLLTIEGLRTEPQTLENLWGELRGLRYSFWGLFGWFSILLPDPVYKALDAVSLLAVIGLVLAEIQAWRRSNGQADWSQYSANWIHLLLLVWAVMLAAMMLYWATFATSSQGRLLFPNISAYGVLLAIGLNYWLRVLPRLARWAVLTVLPLGLLACSLYALTVLLPASYHAPKPVTSIPVEAQRVDRVYDGQIDLIAVEIPDGRFRPGDKVPITLYMRAKQPLTTDYPLFVQLLDQSYEVIGNVTTHPGWGRNPTTLWTPGAIYADRYQVVVEGAVSNRSPLLAQVHVGFVNPRTRIPIPVLSADGQPSQRTVGYVEIVSPQPLDPQVFYLRPADVIFGGAIGLVGYDFPGVIAAGDRRAVVVTLLWEAFGVPAADYTAYVHLLNKERQQVAGHDQPPAEGRFPTQYWRTGDRSFSRFVLEWPQAPGRGTYEVWVGLYTSGSAGLPRLPITHGNLPVQDNQVFLGTIEVR